MKATSQFVFVGLCFIVGSHLYLGLHSDDINLLKPNDIYIYVVPQR